MGERASGASVRRGDRSAPAFVGTWRRHKGNAAPLSRDELATRYENGIHAASAGALQRDGHLAVLADARASHSKARSRQCEAAVVRRLSGLGPDASPFDRPFHGSARDRWIPADADGRTAIDARRIVAF